MTVKQQYAVLAGTLLVETVVAVLLCGIAMYAPGTGALSFLAGASIVFYYSARHPAPFGIAAGLFNTLLLAYFSQSRALPTALLLLLVTGVSPYIEQLAPVLARITFAGAYTCTVLLLSSLARGNSIPGISDLALFATIAIAVGFGESRYLIRRSPLEQYHG
ncbi:MAG: hypothetical protein ABFD13_02830 [Candidatus Cryosericum sp.]|nr:hypothetical protein [bacterium]